jgi:large subunit ribosomal protein L25
VHISAVNFPPGSRPVITDRDFTIASIAASSAVREEAAAATTTPAAEQPATC